jgi:hypothetical protein
VPNETGAVESLTDDNFDSLDLIDQLMLAEEEPRSPSDAVPLIDQGRELPQSVQVDSGANREADALIDTNNDAGGDAAAPHSAGGINESGLDESVSGQFESLSLPAVDLTAFQSLPFEDVFSNGVLFVSIAAFIVAGLYVTGAGMKLACHITGGGRITIRRGIVATILMSVAYAGAAGTSGSITSTSSLLLALGYQVGVGTLVLAFLLWQNPIRALATGVIASILQTIFLFGIFAASLILIGKFAPPQKLQQLAKHTQPLTDSLAKEVLPGDEEKTRQLLSIQSLLESPKAHASGEEQTKSTPIYERGLRNNPFAE